MRELIKAAFNDEMIGESVRFLAIAVAMWLVMAAVVVWNLPA